MKFPQITLMNKSLAVRALVFAVCVAAMTVSISAQKRLQKALESPFAPTAIGIDIEQCANGPLANPNKCNIASGNDGWSRGNVNESKSHYYEGDFVPIRFIATDLTVDQEYTVTLGYDYTKGGKYATDYLGSYDYTETDMNNPCVNVDGCDPTVFTTEPVPTDPQVTAGFDGMLGTADDIVQIPGVFTCFGCTITNVSDPVLSGSTSGDSSKSFTITFTANQENVVIAYGSHISTRQDWGLTNSAVNISGSPYHNFVVAFPGANGGSRDLQLSASAVIFPAFITIEKTVHAVDPLTNVILTSSTYVFGFTSSAALFPNTNFTLIDNVAETFDPAVRVGATIDSLGITSFGSGNLITVTEGEADEWTLASITCSSINGTNNNSFGTRSVSIQLEEGESVKCSFHNTQLIPSAAPASVSGRVVDSFGNGIGNARLTMTDAQSGNSWSVITNPFGYYTIADAEVGNFYTMTVSHKRYSFIDDTRTFSLNEDLVGMDFIANP